MLEEALGRVFRLGAFSVSVRWGVALQAFSYGFAQGLMASRVARFGGMLRSRVAGRGSR
jgi:hypothetical protein